MKYFVANWKANKNLNEANQWIDTFLKLPLRDASQKVVICPPTPFLYPLKQKIENLNNVFLGVQDISQFESGSYTGEVTAKTLQGTANYAIIGHSERRKHFQEQETVLFKKASLAKKYKIEPIFCLRNSSDRIPKEANIVAYEPVYAIGTGQNEALEKVLEMKSRLPLSQNTAFLYGGSANKDNVATYLSSPQIDGFLVGTASLDPQQFFEIISQA